MIKKRIGDDDENVGEGVLKMKKYKENLLRKKI